MNATFEVEGRHILVTGGSSGLGRHFATVLAAAGARVCLAARREHALEEVAGAIRQSGGNAQAVGMDVTASASIEAALDRAEARFGPVEVLVNNAGTAASQAAMELDEATWDKVIDTNLKGVWLTAQAAARRMVRHGVAGSIVNIASILGLRVAGGVAPYAASKAAVIQLSKALALEWARHRIRVNALAPGYIETDINRDFFETPAGQALVKRIPQRRLGQARELDGALLLLASDAGSYITGSVIAVDGGHLVSGL
jgi:NAD(P)-dependent dehydrogenase (short-subunit alcohol dehydrogenase family)